MKNYFKIITVKTQQIPFAVQIFLLRAFCFVIGWILLYQFILMPARFPDKWLTNITAASTSEVLNFILLPVYYIAAADSATIFSNGKILLIVGDNCNALSLYVLYSGFLICMPASFKKTISFLIFGVLAIFVLNVMRCIAIAWLKINFPGWVDFAHKYAFTTIVYCCIFLGWILYTNDYGKKKSK